MEKTGSHILFKSDLKKNLNSSQEKNNPLYFKMETVTSIKSVLLSYSKTRMAGLFAPSTTPGSVVFQGVTPGLRNIALIGDPVQMFVGGFFVIENIKPND